MDIFSVTTIQLERIIVKLGVEKYRAKQILSSLYKHHINSIEEITVLKKELRKTLKDFLRIDRPKLINLQRAKDGVEKFLFELHDGNTIETVLIPMKDNRKTICISTQVGCKMGCRFCATGYLGFKRNLTPGEIVSQVEYVMKTGGIRAPNVVYMGMGEPLDNYNSFLQSLRILTDKYCLNISPRKITLSTCGLTDKLNRLKKDFPHINLAISLHSVDERKRSNIMPINKKYPLKALLQAVKDFPIPKRKRVTFEYIMFNGFNDTKEDEKLLLRILSNQKSKLNIIPYNLHPIISSNLKPTSMEKIVQFAENLRKKGVFVTIRDSKGHEISGACGMLIAKHPSDKSGQEQQTEHRKYHMAQRLNQDSKSSLL